MTKKSVYNFQTYDDSELGMNNPLFLIQHNNTNTGYATITIRPVWMRNDKVRFYSHEAIFKDLQISCQWNLYTQVDESFNRPYAWHINYTSGLDIESLGEAQEKLNFLKKINKEMGKIQEKFGYSESFEDYIMRISAVLSIENFVTLDSQSDEISRLFKAVDAKRYIKDLYTK